MNNNFRNEFADSLVGLIPNSYLADVLKAFDVVSTKYTINQVSNELVVYEEKIPNEFKWYVADLNVRNLSPLSIKNYTIILNVFFRAMKYKPISEIKTNEIQAFLYWYQYQRKGRELNGKSIDKVRQILNCFFRWCVDLEYINKNPMRNIKKIKSEYKQRLSLNTMEVEQIRNECTRIRDKAMFEFFIST